MAPPRQRGGAGNSKKASARSSDADKASHDDAPWGAVQGGKDPLAKYKFAGGPDGKTPETNLTRIGLYVVLAIVVAVIAQSRRPRGRTPWVRVPSVLDTADLEVVEQAFETARASEIGAANQSRSFGLGQDYLAGHRVVFLDAETGPFATSIVPLLARVAMRADREASWGLFFGRGSEQLKPRVAELIEYEAAESDPARHHALGWHDDGSTLATVAVALSHEADYDGGEFEAYMSESAGPEGIVTASRVNVGDATVWRGWDRHRVRPVTRGLRRVLVIEFWEEAVRSEATGRLGDTTKSYKRGLELAPSAAGLHAGLGSLASRAEKYKEAEVAFSAALQLAPTRADFHARLGQSLFNQRRVGVAMKALKNMKGLGNLQLGSMESEGAEFSEKAEESLLSAVRLDPTLADAHAWLGKLYEERGDKDRGEHHKVLAESLGYVPHAPAQ